MMREKYESLPLATLKELAKARDISGISGMKKAQLIERMLEEDIRDKERSANTGDRDKQEIHDIDKLDSGETASGILEVMTEGFGFIRCENYLPGENDVYVSPSQIRRFNLKTGDILEGNTRIKTQQEKFSALLYLSKVNGIHPAIAAKRPNFEDLTPIFPNKRLSLETGKTSTAMRIMDLMSPIGKGQRGMIVSPPKAGKTTLLKQVALSVRKNNPQCRFSDGQHMFGSIEQRFHQEAWNGLEDDQTDYHDPDRDQDTHADCVGNTFFMSGTVIVCDDRDHSIIHTEYRHEDKALQFEIYTVYGCGSRREHQ